MFAIALSRALHARDDSAEQLPFFPCKGIWRHSHTRRSFQPRERGRESGQRCVHQIHFTAGAENVATL